jgi:glutamine amidotransferase
MCRHLAYLGPPIALARLLFDAPHALVRQSWAPQDMRGGGTINADGFGVGWYPRPDAPPVRYRRDHPMWTDLDLPGLAAATMSGAVLAAVRSATASMPVTVPAAAPFAEGKWLFSHNGAVAGWPDSLVPLANRLPVRDLVTLDAPTDSALLWALVRDRLRDGTHLTRALAETVAEVAVAAPGSRLNRLAPDGTTAVASTDGHSLSVRQCAGEVLLSSEPLDEHPAWRPVPDKHLVVATRSTVDIIALHQKVGTP